MGGSVLGRAMHTNQEQLRDLLPDDAVDATTLRATEDFLADVVDNILNLLVSTRYVSAGHSDLVSAEVTTSALELGSETYAIAVVAMSSASLLLHLIFAIQTRLWSEMIELDLTNMAHVISSAVTSGAWCEQQGLPLPSSGACKVRLILRPYSSRSGRLLPILKPFLPPGSKTTTTEPQRDEKFDNASASD